MKIIVLYPLKWKTDPEQVICEAAAQKPDLIACIASPALALDNARKTLAEQYALVLHDELFRKWNKVVGNPKLNAVTGVFAADSLDFTEEERPGHRYFDNVIDRYLAISTEHGYIRADNIPHFDPDPNDPAYQKNAKQRNRAVIAHRERCAYKKDVESDMHRKLLVDENALFFGSYPSDLVTNLSQLISVSEQHATTDDCFAIFATKRLESKIKINLLRDDIYEITF